MPTATLAAADNDHASLSLNLCETGCEFDNDYDGELIALSQEREYLSFTDMASEILELHQHHCGTTDIDHMRCLRVQFGRHPHEFVVPSHQEAAREGTQLGLSRLG